MVSFLESIGSSFQSITSGDVSLPITLIFFTAVIAIYSIFVYYFYRFLARKNIIGLNLNQYNQYENKAVVKFFAVFFYIIEYIILLPVLTFFWFTVLAVLTLILAKGISLPNILLISAALVASVRITSYVSESLSRDLAKLVPFTLLVISITTPSFFEVSSLISRALEVPTLLNQIPVYLIFIVIIELIMRFFDMIRNAFENKGRKLGTERE